MYTHTCKSTNKYMYIYIYTYRERYVHIYVYIQYIYIYNAQHRTPQIRRRAALTASKRVGTNVIVYVTFVPYISAALTASKRL